MRTRSCAAAAVAAAASLLLTPATASAQDLTGTGRQHLLVGEHPVRLPQAFSSDPLGVGFARATIPVLPVTPFLGSTGALAGAVCDSSGIPVLRRPGPIG